MNEHIVVYLQNEILLRKKKLTKEEELNLRVITLSERNRTY